MFQCSRDNLLVHFKIPHEPYHSPQGWYGLTLTNLSTSDVKSGVVIFVLFLNDMGIITNKGSTLWGSQPLGLGGLCQPADSRKLDK